MRDFIFSLFLLILTSHIQAKVTTGIESPSSQRCGGRNVDKEKCCTNEEPCNEGEGDCENNDECEEDLVCGNNNCKVFGDVFHEKDDCCVKNSDTDKNNIINNITNKEFPLTEPNPGEISNVFSKIGVVFPLTEPFPGQRCSGRNYQGRRCCTPEQPCGEGEGDCDGPGDGGANDGHAGCQGDLECGSNNCMQFGIFYHEKDDCCQKPSLIATEKPTPIIFPGTPVEPPAGQRCTGRNYQGKRCCTPDQPCDEGEGDCDGPGDGGANDGHAGCKGDLECGSNNCKQFGAFYHEKDDCCERPTSAEGWGGWQAWSQCSQSCGIGRKTRDRFCLGTDCSHSQQSQDRLCNTDPCTRRVQNNNSMVNAFLCVLLDWFC